jgi:uncharacterized protein (TIGR00730 family)
MPIHSLAVFCGSKNGNDPSYMQDAKELGKLMAEKNITLVYGGGKKGLMGAVADAVMQNNGKAIGVIPELLLEWEHQHDEITQLIVVDNMHLRKKKIYEFSDAAIILPGGFGTMDEFFEIVTWNQLAIHDKMTFILNSGSYYDHLIRHIAFAEEKGFLYQHAREKLFFLNRPYDLVAYLK